MNFYAGIGSRKTPNHILKSMEKIAWAMAEAGLTLRSGGADGADLAFENGCDKAGGIKEIFLPWEGFNENESKLFTPSQEAYDIAREYHPYWETMKETTRRIMARNVHQVLGLDCMTPVSFVVCWTPDGGASGGTGQAIRIAEAGGISVINLYNNDER